MAFFQKTNFFHHFFFKFQNFCVDQDIFYRIEATEEAIRMQNAKAFNMIVLGGFLKIKPIVKLENIVKGLQKSLPKRHHHLIPMNEQAIYKGMEIVQEVK